jgi:deoxyhypusine synthase
MSSVSCTKTKEEQQSLFDKVVMAPSTCTPLTAKVCGYDFNKGIDLSGVLGSYITTGFQATAFGRAVETVNRMLSWTLNDEPIVEDEDDAFRTANMRQKVRCKVFLSFTSNIISAGTREVLRYLAEHSMVQVMITTAGGIEEDFVKCLADMHLGEFYLSGSSLRKEGLNRTGNLLVPNSNYVLFGQWLLPILDAMHDEQETQNVHWTPSKMIARLGKEINNPQSVYYWCYKNNTTVFSPAITDGSIGDMLFAHCIKRPGLIIDIVEDVWRMDNEALSARKSGVLILGGGLAKHHNLNAHIMRNGADFAVYVNTAQEFDGSDAGASPDEAVSWGKINIDCKPVKVNCDATIVLPILVAQTFAKRQCEGLCVGNSNQDSIFDKSLTKMEDAKEKEKAIHSSDSVLKKLGII